MLEGVAAFLEEERGQVEGAEVVAEFLEAGEGEVEVADGVVVGGVYAEGDEEGVGFVGFDSGGGVAQGVEPFFFGAVAGQGEVGGEGFAFAGAGFGGVAPEVGVLGVGVGVEGGEEDIAAVVEDVLRAVAVVVVDIKDGDTFHAGEEEMLCGDGSIVEEAEAAAVVGAGVVAGGAAEGVGGFFTGEDGVRGGEGGEGGVEGGGVGAGGDGRGEVEAIVAGLGGGF